MTGIVKSRGAQIERGFVFIESEGVDYFAHATSCDFEFTEQIIGAAVEFNAFTDPRGFVARNVRLANE